MAQVDINGSLSEPFPLTRSIRQGCPLAPALFVIASEALTYILTDDTLSPAVKGITLPNNEDLSICQFADDTSLFIKMEDDNFNCLTKKLDLFCSISGAKLSQAKCICLGWDEHPPGWLLKFGFQWGGPTTITKYLGIPFAVDPSIKDMWLWVKTKITKKLNSWFNRFLSLAGRLQVCQKILSSYNIYYASAWMFNNYQILEIQKAIRNFLWSNGKGNKKCHMVKWDWCCTDKKYGGLGLKDLRLQGIALATKWISHCVDGEEPWKVLVRNNILRGYPKKAKTWKNLPFADIIFGKFPTAVHGSAVFKTLWRAWELSRHCISDNAFHSNDSLHGERSIWWNLYLQGKPLALTQGCSAKVWNNLGISTFMDLFENDCLINWDELRYKYNLPIAHKKTYSMLTRACSNIPSNCLVDSHRFTNSKWTDSSLLTKLKAKNVYNSLNNNLSIIKHVNNVWYTDLEMKDWNKNFKRIWKSSIDPKIRCFRWLLLINRIPINNYQMNYDSCTFCNKPETCRHIFFECNFAKKVWELCGITYPKYIDIFEIITGYIHGLKNDSNILWFIISANILWQLWKCRNEERFQGAHRSLTELYLKLTLIKISSQVCITMMIEREKLIRFLKMGHSTMFVFEMKDGYDYRNHMNNMVFFNKTVKKLHKEITKNKNATDDQIKMIAQIQVNKSIAWMEGPLGWTAWVDQFEDLLH
ncbi:uncharacterized protein LOC131874899 [Cryptomeria japonica]|uniref:uncharacterized protein LOC131874899 n=1 Tax=Cryptomeria japonica TaxID=3369 RepID=UPI0027DA51D4|nr:uncharacterized protein LOC131874899 [Cryptomeria japonica]